MSVAVKLEQVSKKFTLQHQRSRSWQELVLNFLQGKENKQHEQFWSLREVSFEIASGETVGLIGSNGAGKSTLLKLISRIIQPTSGRIQINGRVGALLELGSGFHPDMTGRENIYLNGSILGLSQTEIRRKLDEIITFAELERFIDLPVKHYSSGMYLRLGFSVAVHTEPDILLVDEVLAVGDAAFQRKCMEQIDQLRQQGVTIFFVSHDLDTVRRICQRAIWIDKGKVLIDGATETVARQYIWHSYEENPVTITRNPERRWGNNEVKIEQVYLLDGEGKEQKAFGTGEMLVVEICYRAARRMERPVFGLAIHRSDGIHVAGPNTQFNEYEIPWIEGVGTVQYTVPHLPLLEGTYYISVAAHDARESKIFDYHDQLYSFRVYRGKSRERYGLITLGGDWSLDLLLDSQRKEGGRHTSAEKKTPY